MLKLAALLVVLPAFLFFFGLLGLKWVVEINAHNKARMLVGSIELPRDNIDATAIYLTSEVHKAYRNTASDAPVPFIMRARPYLTHRFIPEFLRVQPGAIDTLYLDGLCDNAARTLVYVLNKNGFEAAQFNMVTPSSAHSAVIAKTPDGRRLLLDPDKGVVPVENGKVMSPEQAQARMRNGGPRGPVWSGLSPSADTGFYEQFTRTRFARQGSRLEIDASVVLPGGQAVQLGKPDGSSADVSNEGGQAALSPYWHYIGSRYDRAWVRRMHFAQATRMTIVLTESPRIDLVTTDRIPKITGRTLVYEFKAGETLRFEDGRAGFDWFRLRSYQDIDYIRFDPISYSIFRTN